VSNKIKDTIAEFIAAILIFVLRTLVLWWAWAAIQDGLGLPALTWAQCMWLFLGYHMLTNRWVKKRSQ